MILATDVAHEHVGRLDVSVHEADVMDRLERPCQLDPDEHCPLGGQPLVAIDEGPQLQAVNPLHGQVKPASLLADIEDRDHVGMVNGGGKPRLPQETRAIVTRLGNFRTNYLKSHCSPKNSLLGPVDEAHAARAHHLDDVVPTEGLALAQLRTHASRPSLVLADLLAGERIRPTAC